MTDDAANDLVARPLPFLLAWGVPIAVLIALTFVEDRLAPAGPVLIAGALSWAGVACIANARACGRRHCYLSGPIFLVGAGATVLFGFDVVLPGPDALDYIVWGTLAFVALTFVPKLIWGRYVRRREIRRTRG